MITAGTAEQISWGGGSWICLDIGFSSTKKSCGLIIGDGEAKCVDFADAQARIVQHVSTANSVVNLVIEAPLSVAFRNGLPVPRSIERKDDKSRAWYVGPGCAVMVAAMYLIKEIASACSGRELRLFEAFISYKEPGLKSDHAKEAQMLRDIVRGQKRGPDIRIIGANELKQRAEDQLASAFSVMGMDCGVPAVLMI